MEAINKNFKEGFMLAKMERKRKWNERWVKFDNGQLLIFKQKGDKKASNAYLLKECRLKEVLLEGKDVEKMKRSTSFKLKNNDSMNKVSSEKPPECSSTTIYDLTTGPKVKAIEVEHPLLESCYLRSVKENDTLTWQEFLEFSIQHPEPSITYY